MATTGFWPVKGRLKDVINYAENPDKTIDRKYLDDDLAAALNYVENSDKTDQTMYVSGINCPKKRAYEAMMTTKRRYGKLGGNVAYHGYQSFRTGEVTAEEAHRIGIETAQRMWGKDYEMIVATHQNARCMHCHIVINSVSMTDGKKMNENKAMYNRFRSTADRVCFEHGLSVILKPKGKRVPYNVYMAQQKGVKTKYDYMKAAIDFAIQHSPDGRRFLQVMRDQGYFISNFGSPERYATIRSRTDEHGVRLANLGADYTPEAIRNRIRMQDRYELNGNIMGYNHYKRYFVNNVYVYRYKNAKMAGSCVQGMLGGVIIGAPVISLLLLALLFVGALVEVHDCNPHPMSPEMKQLRPKITFMQEQIDLAVNEKLYSYADVEKFIADTSLKMEQLKFERSKVYNKIRGCKDPVKLAELVKQRDGMTAELARLRNKLKLAQRIIDDQPMLRGKVEAEKEQMREWYFPQRTLEQNKDRHRDDGAR